jgi:hypothetical protein
MIYGVDLQVGDMIRVRRFPLKTGSYSQRHQHIPAPNKGIALRESTNSDIIYV